MRVCLVNPPLEDFYATTIRRQPLGLLYIASVLKQAGHTVQLINGHSPKKHKLPWPKQFEYLKEYLVPQDNSVKFPFKDYYHFGLSYEEIARQIRESDAEYYFVSALFTTYYEETEKIISMVRQIKPQAKIAVGGYHAALYPDYFKNELGIDALIPGEAELAILKLLNNEQYDNIELIKDLDTIPFPDRSLLKPRDLKVYKQQAVSLIMSRGCPNRCDFCSSRDFWENLYRLRSPVSVLAEIDECYKKYGVTLFNFEDDNLFLDLHRSQELLNSLCEYQEANRIKLDLTAMNGISIEKMDDDFLELMRKAGFKEINLSLVSYSKGLQNKLNRPFDSAQFSRIVKAAQKQKMNVRAYFILGHPEQTKQEIEETINYLKDLNVKAFPSVFYNVNSPKLEWKAQRSSGFFNETKYLSRRDLLYYFNQTLLLN
jgi:radical SAM superfamily enzyme YgiQ (UPF0313 family)